jgi:glycosyltransferase involved in cell wall biosynthesis
MRVLFLSNWYPYPPDNGSKIRIFNLIKGIARENEVTLISFTDPGESRTDNHLGEICKAVYSIPKKEYDARSVSAILGLFGRKPRVLVDRFTPEMNNRIKDEVTSGNYDVIIASQMYMAAYLDSPRNIPAVFEEVEIGVFEDSVINAPGLIKKVRNQLTLTKMGSYYKNLFPHYSACTVVSELEKKRLIRMVPGYKPIEVIPNGVDLSYYRDIQNNPKPNQLIFTGSFAYRPNYEAMEWFMSYVFPEILSQNPETQLTITGDSSNRQLTNTKHVNFPGHVDDVRPLIASSWISLVPIFTGGGTRLKILEAFALQTPVVATSKGAEGLDVATDVHLLIADTPEEYAEQTLRLLQDERLRERLVINAYKLVEEKYDWAVIMPKFMRLIQQVANSPPDELSEQIY